ncbi:MAG: helix-turn-helix transcriptional regulator [Propionibacteriaceae bacterium]
MDRDRIDSQTHRVLSGVSRVAVLEALRASARPLDVQAIAAAVGLHANTVRSHLDQLVDAGLASRATELRTTPGRPRLLFRAAAQPTGSDAEDSYRMLARVLASGIDEAGPRTGQPGSVATEAGRRWGQRAVEAQDAPDASPDEHSEPGDHDYAVGRIVALLDDVGFAPRLRVSVAATTDPRATGTDPATATVIELHQCPFKEVAIEHSEIVCGVHLGLIQGALDQMHASPFTVRLEPFVSPVLCLAHLAPTGTEGAGHPGLARWAGRQTGHESERSDD